MPLRYDQQDTSDYLAEREQRDGGPGAAAAGAAAVVRHQPPARPPLARACAAHTCHTHTPRPGLLAALQEGPRTPTSFQEASHTMQTLPWPSVHP